LIGLPTINKTVEKAGRGALLITKALTTATDLPAAIQSEEIRRGWRNTTISPYVFPLFNLFENTRRLTLTHTYIIICIQLC